MDEMYNEMFWINFANEISGLREKERQKLPYNFNLMYELRADENAHTRLLLNLLNYNVNGDYTFLRSFITQICIKKNIDGLSKNKIENPKITICKEYIDGLIEDYSKKYSIIIENKINGARDQYKQIERYYSQVKQHGVNEDNIYVIYLTIDGEKKVASDSLPEWLRDKLGNRFIELNYKCDIIPWLKNDILPNIMRKDNQLECSIVLYIDYLERKLNISEKDQYINDIMDEMIKNKLGLDSIGAKEKWEFLESTIKQLTELRNDLENIKEETFKRTLEDWDAVAKMYFMNNVYSDIKNGYYQIFLNNINRDIHFEWIPIYEKDLFTSTSYRMVLHVENDNENLNMLKLARNDALREKAYSLNYELVFSENNKNSDALCKWYYSDKPFAEMNLDSRNNFFNQSYLEVKELKNIIEETFHKLDGEVSCINELSVLMRNMTKHDWKVWPENKDIAWDLVASFNNATNPIGIEASFAVNKDKQVVFRSYITVWRECYWNIYENELIKQYPGLNIDKSGRVYLHLLEILIGESIDDWNTQKEKVIKSLNETYLFMENLTSKVGK
ncbi:PD-(D/E)XK nuclease family protein [Bacteroides sp.]|uniref:PD-(D/E)XK nuclease family protein n=1 Tax=Bacteroides sp. TaxID=29523 RepID=UPI0025BF7CDD|nr:PD-(D/E)XK nuclease family protein [Bacteroides sp.]